MESTCDTELPSDVRPTDIKLNVKVNSIELLTWNVEGTSGMQWVWDGIYAWDSVGQQLSVQNPLSPTYYRSAFPNVLAVSVYGIGLFYWITIDLRSWR
jgi:hypothetical protein